MLESAHKTSRNFSPYPLIWLAGSFALGILIGNKLAFSWQVYLVICSASVFPAAFFQKQKFAAVFLLIAFLCLGAFCLRVEKQSVAPDRLKILYDKGELISGEPIEITGILQGKPEISPGGFFLRLKAENVTYKTIKRDVSGTVRLFVPVLNEQTAGEYEQLHLEYGTKIRIACELRREEKYLNPGGISRKEILDEQELDATGTIKSPLLIEILGQSKNQGLLAWVSERRHQLILDFKKHFSVSTAGVLIASLLGNRYHLDKPTAERFREGGTFHIVVISGLQITFIGGLSILLMRRITKKRWAQFLAASSFLWIYTITVGADVPVSRAAIMFTVLHFATVIFRRANLLNALGVSGLLLLVWRPSDLFDQSLQLTFACLMAIVAMAFPLLEKARAIGEWRPSTETPIPPACSKKLKTFCESLYWSERDWQREQKHSVWQAKLFKSTYAEKLEQRKLQIILRYLFETIAVSVVVQIWLIPFLVVYFHRISLVAIFLNIWAGILIAIESLFALTAIMAAQLSEILALPFIKLTEALNWLLLHFTDLFIDAGWASLRLPHYSGSGKIFYFLYYVPIVLLTVLIQQWKPFALKTQTDKSIFAKNSLFIKQFAFTGYLILFSVIVFHPFSSPQTDGRLHIDFLDVGQGDSILVTLPTGETLLVDGGGKANFNAIYVKREDEEPEFFEPDVQNIGESVVSNFLWEKGYDRVDFILATHADTDHIQGLTDVARNFKVRVAFFGRMPFEDTDFQELADVLKKRNVPLMKLSRGDIINFDEVKVEPLYPYRDEGFETASDNNQSVVLRISFGERKFLLTGDIEKEAENEILKNPEFIQADVVKVAHHGSKTSSTEMFVHATQAKVAVVPVGRESPFGHPKAEIVERWKASGAKVLTTGENGTISFSTNGKDLQLKTFVEKTVYR